MLLWTIRHGRVLELPKPSRGDACGLTASARAVIDAGRRGFGEKLCYHHWQGVASCCDVVVLEENDCRSAVVLLSGRDDNKGAPLMNAVEDVASIVYNQRLRHLAPRSIAWFFVRRAQDIKFDGAITAVYMDFVPRRRLFVHADFFPVNTQ